MTLSIQHPAAPGAYLQRNDRAPATVALRTDIAGFVGIAERGPVGVAVAVESMRQFQAVFGGYIGGGFLAYSVRAFFENGGRRARIVRVASDDPAQGAAAGAIGIPVVGGGDPWTVAASSLGAWGNALSVALVERTAGQDHRPEPLAAELRRGRFDVRFRGELPREAHAGRRADPGPGAGCDRCDAEAAVLA